MTLPYDYTRCPGSRCEVREACARHIAARPNGYHGSNIDYSTLGTRVDRAEACENFIAGSEKSKEAA